MLYGENEMAFTAQDKKNIKIVLPDFSLRKHVYSNILKILPPKNENFQMKTSDVFHISAQNIDCGTR